MGSVPSSNTSSHSSLALLHVQAQGEDSCVEGGFPPDIESAGPWFWASQPPGLWERFVVYEPPRMHSIFVLKAGMHRHPSFFLYFFLLSFHPFPLSFLPSAAPQQLLKTVFTPASECLMCMFMLGDTWNECYHWLFSQMRKVRHSTLDDCSKTLW